MRFKATRMNSPACTSERVGTPSASDAPVVSRMRFRSAFTFPKCSIARVLTPTTCGRVCAATGRQQNIRISVYVNQSIRQIVTSVKETLARRFGRCVRLLRLEAGYTQVELAELCGFYQTYLSRLERGMANPTLNAMEVIANALGLSIYELWERTRVCSSTGSAGKKANPAGL